MKNKLLIIFVFIILVFEKANALTFNLDCPLKVKKDNTISIPVYVNKDSSEEALQLSNIKGTLSYNNSKLQMIEFEQLLPNWLDKSQNNTFDYEKMEEGNFITQDNTFVFNIKFKVVNDNSTDIDLSIINTYVKDENGNSLSNVNGSECIIAMMSDNNNLSNIMLSSGTLSPTFDPNVLLYNVTVDAETITISYQKSHRKAIVDCECDNHKLNYGNNAINIKVTAENGSSKTYVINIIRPDNRDTNNNLSSLILSKGKINFNSNTTSYNVEVDSNVDKLTITSSLDSFMASYVDWSATKEVSLKYGLNTFTITVKAENETTKTYKLNITRKDDRDSDNSLSDITVSSGNINFDSNILEYTINVTSNIDVISIEPKTSSKKAKYEVNGPKNLEYGENVYEIKVTAENESVKTYKITVIRNEEDVELSSVALLEYLNIEGYEIDFDPNKFEYVIRSNNMVFNITTKAQDGGNYYILNNGKVDKDGILTIRVTALDGSINNYVIKVKPLANNHKIIMFIIVLGVILLIVLGIIYFIINKNKNIEKKILLIRLKTRILILILILVLKIMSKYKYFK